jgi:hypothetical protein
VVGGAALGVLCVPLARWIWAMMTPRRPDTGAATADPFGDLDQSRPGEPNYLHTAEAVQ